MGSLAISGGVQMSDFALNGLRALKLSAVLVLAGATSGCVTTVLAVGANAATVAMSDKTAGTAIDDSAAAGEIRAKLIQGKGYSLGDVQVAVADGFILLAGTTPTPQDRIEAERRAWTVAGARTVANEISVGKRRSIPAAVEDNTISAQVRSKYFNSKSVKGLNYTIETNQKTVYLLGIARNRSELTDAVEQARHVGGVQKVVSYVRIMDKPVIEKPETAAQAAAMRAEQLGLQGGPQPQQTMPYAAGESAPADYAQYDFQATPGADPYAPPSRGTPPQYNNYNAQPSYEQPRAEQSGYSSQSYNQPAARQQPVAQSSGYNAQSYSEARAPVQDYSASQYQAPTPQTAYAAPNSYAAPPYEAPPASPAGPMVLTPQ